MKPDIFKQFREFYQRNRRYLMVMAPGWMLAVLFISIVVMHCLGVTLLGETTLTSFALVIFLGIVAIATSFYGTYVCFFMYDVDMENIQRMQRLFLNGYPAWEYLDSRVFPRLRCYVGHELCYEAAALEMIAWRGHGATYYVFADVWSQERNCRCEHSWIEVKRYGIWWVIDPTWSDPVSAIPRWMYNMMHFTRYVRAFNSYGFWSSSLANTFYERLNRPSTSYLFGELGLFRRDNKSNNMYADSSCKNKLGNGALSDGRDSHYIFGDQRPISQEIIAQFLSKPELMMPTMRAQKHAMVMIGRA